MEWMLSFTVTLGTCSITSPTSSSSKRLCTFSPGDKDKWCASDHSENIPNTSPFSTTGNCENRFSNIRRNAAPTRALGGTVSISISPGKMFPTSWKGLSIVTVSFLQEFLRRLHARRFRGSRPRGGAKSRGGRQD